MKKFIYFLVLLLFVGCSNEQATEEETGKMKVVASFYPIADFVERIGGERVEVQTLIGAGVDPHSWEMTTKEREILEKSSLFIYNGSGFEHWADDVIQAAKETNEDFVAIETSKGLTLEEGHDHEDDTQEDQDHGAYDSHTWISLPNAVHQMEVIKDVLSTQYPEWADEFNTNFEREKDAFLALHERALDAFEEVERKDFIVGHESFGYLARDYGLTQHGIEGASSLGEPDPKRMAELVHLAKETGLSTIFYDPLGSDKIAQTIASEIGGTTEALNPLEGRTQEEIEENLDYLAIMQKNINTLYEALE